MNSIWYLFNNKVSNDVQILFKTNAFILDVYVKYIFKNLIWKQWKTLPKNTVRSFIAVHNQKVSYACLVFLVKRKGVVCSENTLNNWLWMVSFFFHFNLFDLYSQRCTAVSDYYILNRTAVCKLKCNSNAIQSKETNSQVWIICNSVIYWYICDVRTHYKVYFFCDKNLSDSEITMKIPSVLGIVCIILLRA